MSFDYAPALATAKRMIRNFGRQVTLVQLGATSSDATKPWRGAADPRGAEAATVQVHAVGVPVTGLASLGFRATQTDLLKDVDAVMLMEPGEADPENLDDYNVLREADGEELHIRFVERLKPASTTLLYYIGVGR